MKATLSFNLPEEYEELLAAQRGCAYRSALTEMDDYFRSRLKYEEHPENVREALEKAREALWQYINDAEDK